MELEQEIRRALEEAGDPAKAPDMQRYMKSQMPYRGVSMPVLRKVVRPLIKAAPIATREEWANTVLALWDDARYREERYAALELVEHKRFHAYRVEAPPPATMGLYRHLVETGAWWDTVDWVASRFVGELARAHPNPVQENLHAWARDEDMWVRRTAIIAQLGSGPATNLDLLTHAIDANLPGSTYGREFFIRKAIGWALRQHARTDPDWVRAFVHERGERLSPLSRREALKHIT